MKSFVFVLLCTSFCFGQTPASAPVVQRLPVSVLCNCEDDVGHALKYYLVDAIAKSGVYRPATAADKSDYLAISMVSLDPTKEGNQTAAAVDFLFYSEGSDLPVFLRNEILVVGKSRVEEYGKGILLDLDKEVDERIKARH